MFFYVCVTKYYHLNINLGYKIIHYLPISADLDCPLRTFEHIMYAHFPFIIMAIITLSHIIIFHLILYKLSLT